MLGPDGLDADGLKIDFTARTPSGRALAHRGPDWGIALLHRLLEIVYVAAKAAKPDALVITHTPHPAFVDVTDMIRLNDMTSAARPSASRCASARRDRPRRVPGAPDRHRRLARRRTSTSGAQYLALKPELGVPVALLRDALDASGEELRADDYAALRDDVVGWRSRR